jgi:AraC family transcriptional regulator
MSMEGVFAGVYSSGESRDRRAAAEVRRLLQRALKCQQQDAEKAVELVAGALLILCRPRSNRLEGTSQDHSSPRGLAKWQANKVEAFVVERLSKHIAVSELARAANLSTCYFCTLFKATFGLTPHNYIVAKRVERAKHLIEATEASLSEIALNCGLSDQAQLSRHFRRLTGFTPGNWRRVCVGLETSMATPSEVAQAKRINSTLTAT